MSALRRAAASLHGLHRLDQDAILADLSGSEQQQIRHFLAELNDLGFTPDAVLPVPPAPVAPPPPPAPVLAPTPVELARRSLRQASPARLHALLRTESAGLLGQLLALEQWRWRRAFLARFSAPERIAIERAAAGARPARLRDDALLGALAARLAQPRPASPTVPLAMPARRWMTEFGGRLRAVRLVAKRA